jgi:hypothetical protein
MDVALPRAIVLVNAFCRTLTAFSQGDWPLTCANAPDARIRDVENATEADRSRRETAFFRKAFRIVDEFLSDDASRARIGIRKGNLSPHLVGRDGERREPKVEVAASRREAARMEPHEYAQSPVAESRMLSASSDQGQSCCHFRSLLVGEESSESRFLILLVGKKPPKCFKENVSRFDCFFCLVRRFSLDPPLAPVSKAYRAVESALGKGCASDRGPSTKCRARGPRGFRRHLCMRAGPRPPYKHSEQPNHIIFY